MNISKCRITCFYRNIANGTDAKTQCDDWYLMINKFQDAHMRIAPRIGTGTNY